MSNMIHDWEDASSISSITCFSLPDLILHARHIHAHFELSCAWFLSLHSPLISRSQRWQSGSGRFCLVLFRKGRKEGPVSASSVGALSGSGFSPLSCSRLSPLLSADIVLSESSSSEMTQWRGCRAFTWRGILSIKIDCGLIILDTSSLPNFVVHWFCSTLTHMHSLTW